MKKIKIFALLAAAAVSFLSTGCIDETFPEGSTVTADQLAGGAESLEASLNGIPTMFSQGYLVYGSQTHETDLGYPLYMIAMTNLTGDIYPCEDGTSYDWWWAYNTFNASMGPSSYWAYLPWFTAYTFIKAANDIIGIVDIDDESVGDDMKGYAGICYAYRAYSYYLLTLLFEPKENIYTDASNVLGLTVPIVTYETTGDESKNNPRVSHDEMIEFMLSDLDIAESLLSNYSPSSKKFPDLSVVYALKAKVYLLDEQYANAATYARKAIDNSGATPMSESEWTDPSSGFNTVCSSWLWYTNYDAENMSNLANFTGWMAQESDWGYASLTQYCLDRALYDEINATDFRKHVFLDPEKYDYYNYQTCRDEDWINDAPDYLMLKFRCLGGDYETYTIGGAVDIPILRVEEMYFIEAEAVGTTQGVTAGTSLLNSFMQTYRDPQYASTATTLEDLQQDIYTQMRIEFVGEGKAFQMAKRLQLGCMQYYEGSNAPSDEYRVNCKGMKPNWTLMIPQDELDANSAIYGYNNPDPSQAIDYPSPIGEYSDPL